jgi:energy-coupling factor transporter ATP-binding protein EcfA2
VDGLEVVALHGSPGSGKTTLSRAISELLRTADTPNAAIDLDDLSMIYPDPRRSFARDNLQAIWPNYAAVPQLKVLIPSVIAAEQERELLHAAASGARLVVCELTAPGSVLKDRVTSREPNEHWRTTLRDLVDLHPGVPTWRGSGTFKWTPTIARWMRRRWKSFAGRGGGALSFDSRAIDDIPGTQGELLTDEARNVIRRIPAPQPDALEVLTELRALRDRGQTTAKDIQARKCKLWDGI